MSGRFVHLHCHSHYSLLDGASSINRLIDRAKHHGMNALADGPWQSARCTRVLQKAKAAGINPIVGYEAYVVPGSRFMRDASSSKDASYHLTLLAKNREGFQNLIKLASKASLEGFYFKPRIDRELIEEFSEGIICLSGCVSSEFSRAILKGRDTAGRNRMPSKWQVVSRRIWRPLFYRNHEQQPAHPATAVGGGS